MSGDSGVSKDSIPVSVRKTIQEIKAFAGNHSDEDVYGMLQECNMDPQETSQMLLYIGTFHEVKTKRNRRKESAESKGSASYRGASGMLMHGVRGGRGNYSSYDGAVGRSSGSRKENAVKHAQITKNNATSGVTKSSAVAVTGPIIISNGSLIHEQAAQPAASGSTDLPKDNSDAVGTNLGVVSPPQPTGDVKSSSPTFNHASASTLTALSVKKVGQGKSTSSSISAPPSTTPASASGSVLVQPLNFQVCGAVGEIRHEVGSQGLGAEPVAAIQSESKTATSQKFGNHALNKPEGSKFSSLANGDSLADKSSPSHDSKPSCITANPSKGRNKLSKFVKADAQSQPLEEATTKTHKRPEPIFPSNLQVPEAYKSGLIFGSLGASFDAGVKDADCIDVEKNDIDVSRSFQDNDGASAGPCPSNQSVSSTAQEEEYLDRSPSPASVSANLLASEENVVSASVPKYDELKQEMAFPSEVPQYSSVQSVSTYSFGFVPPMLSSQLVRAEGPEPQARDVSQLSKFSGGNSSTLSSSVPIPPAVTQPTGIMQSSIPVSPQPVPVFRQPYSPFLPYGQYFSPYYMPPTVHPFLGHSGFPQQQPSTGSIYLTPATSATGLKYPLPQYKLGANLGNPAQVGVPSGFGSYGSAPIGYGPNPMTSGSAAGIENLSVSQSQSKDNKSYITGQQSEGSTIWIPGPGEDNPTLQAASSYYNFPPQGHHVSFPAPQAGGAFAGLYHPTHTMATAPPSVHPLLQQPQAIAGSVEKMGSLGGTYQQQQQQQQVQINWNTNY